MARARRLALEAAVVALLGAAAGAVLVRALARGLVIPSPASARSRNALEDLPLQSAVEQERVAEASWAALLGPTPAPMPPRPRAPLGSLGAAPASPRAPAGAGSAGLPRARIEAGAPVLDLRGLSPWEARALLRGVELEVAAAQGGYRVRALDASGLLSRLGARVDDVVLALNGLPTRDADTALAALLAAQNADRLELRVARQGAEQRLATRVLRGPAPEGVHLEP